MERLAIQLSCYNGARYLPHLFASLAKQTFVDWKLYVLDNASDTENAKAIREAVAVLGEKSVCSRVEKNIDFVGAHNLLWRFHSTPLVQLLNDDAVLEPEYLERLVKVMDANSKCAAASGLIYRWDFDRVYGAGPAVQHSARLLTPERSDGEQAGQAGERGKTDIVDSAGLECGATWKVSDRLAGSVVENSSVMTCEAIHESVIARPVRPKQSYGEIASSPASRERRGPRNDMETETVFGVSGCLPLYRREAIELTAPDRLLFDPLFQSYKEDVDVAFRLNRAGFVSLVNREAVAYHRRSFSPGTQAAQEWRSAFHSYRNHLWVLLYHVTWEDFKTDGLPILLFEVAKLLYWLLKRPFVVLQAIKETFIRRKALWARRKFYVNLIRLCEDPASRERRGTKQSS